MTDAQATRIVLQHGRATGVELRHGKQALRLHAGEVILAGGAFQSPQLLLLSGIGDGERLRALGIAPRVELPGVGRNLHDHASVTAHARCRAPISHARLLNPFRAAVAAFDGLWRRRGFMAECSIEAVGMVRSLPGHGMVNRMELCVPHSRGEVRLASADPLALPIVDANYLAEASDVARLRAALRTALRIYHQPAFAEFGVTPDLPVRDMDDDAALDAYIRSTLTMDHHAAGSCAMGHGPDAVVDAQLRVHGVGQLRVVDASVMPQVVSGNTNAPTIMIAEKASDLILGRAPLPGAPPL